MSGRKAEKRATGDVDNSAKKKRRATSYLHVSIDTLCW